MFMIGTLEPLGEGFAEVTKNSEQNATFYCFGISLKMRFRH